MFVRVAFAAAIHVDPDVLVVDEALAVGDAKFQRKCLLQIEKIRANGAAILFVSHSLETIASLCSRAVILENGGLIVNGEPKQVAEKYLTLLFSESKTEVSEEPVEAKLEPPSTAQPSGALQEPDSSSCTDGLWGDVPLSQRSGYNHHEIRTTNGGAAIVDFVMSANGRTDCLSIVSGTKLTIYVKVQFTEDLAQPIVGFELKTDKGVTLTGSNTYLSRVPLRPVRKGEGRVYQIDFNVPLNEGDYFVDLGVAKYDGSPGGYILDVRRSIIHLIITRMAEKKFDGIVDIGFGFTEVGR
jgi:hypothetical protein